jgi:hypothetical protein
MSLDFWKVYSERQPDQPALIQVQGNEIEDSWSWSYFTSLRNEVATCLISQDACICNKTVFIIGRNSMEVSFVFF